nr:DUF262 domain-containing protein [Bacteroides sp. 51]
MRSILTEKYVIPLYQRGFAWGRDEIHQLLQDIYDSYCRNKDTPENYYIGSLFVLPRDNGNFEVIDGQQRLTVISLIAKILQPQCNEVILKYDARPKVASFLQAFYKDSSLQEVEISGVTTFFDAVDSIRTWHPIQNEKYKFVVDVDFINYFFDHVYLVCVEMPSDTDVAAYFEIMNNRGEQLQKHDILKAQMMGKITCPEKRHTFAIIWDACSQMDTYIQRSFIKDHRERLFGENYSPIPIPVVSDDFVLQPKASNEQNPVKSVANGLSLTDILVDNKNIIESNTSSTEAEDYEDSDGKANSIIDFPNFLMHVLKLVYKRETVKSDIKEVILHERELLNVIDNNKWQENDSMDFIYNLLYYRSVFDTYVIKTQAIDTAADDYKWTLRMPYRDTEKSALRYRNTFGDTHIQTRIIKCLSMLQVTYRTRIYKNWLQDVLSLFKEEKEWSPSDYLRQLDRIVLDYYDRTEIQAQINTGEVYAEGISTPHMLFNLIDYLYWVASKNKTVEINQLKYVVDFEFKYYNSVEHHLPQSTKNADFKKLDCLGNLFLVSRRNNSKMNNEVPIGKASKTGKYYNRILAPNRKIVYDITNKKQKWDEEEIEFHYEDLRKLLSRREEILSCINDDAGINDIDKSEE